MLCNSCMLPVTEDVFPTCSSCNKGIHAQCHINGVCDVCFMNKDAEPVKVDFTIPDHIRRSYIETYKACPFKFLKQVIEGNDMPPNMYTQVGIDLHDLFEKGLNDRSYQSSQMKHDMDHIWNNVYPPMNLFKTPADEQRMYERALNSIDTFYDIVQTMPMPYLTEETILYSIGEDIPKVQFTMDAIFEIPEGLEIIDWKTGKVKVGKQLMSDLQTPLYIYGVQEHTGKHVQRFTYYYLDGNKKRVFEHVQGDEYECYVGKRRYVIHLQDAIKEVKRMFNQIKKGNFNIPQDTKGMYFTCKMCHIKEIGLCEGAETQAWNNVW